MANTAGSEQHLIDALQWCGLSFDEGPGVGGPAGPYVQSERLDLYTRYAGQLLETGHAYRCFCPAPSAAAAGGHDASGAGMAGGEEKEEEGGEVEGEGHGSVANPNACPKCMALPPLESASQAATASPHVIRLKVPSDGATTFTDMVRGDVTIHQNMINDVF